MFFACSHDTHVKKHLAKLLIVGEKAPVCWPTLNTDNYTLQGDPQNGIFFVCLKFIKY